MLDHVILLSYFTLVERLLMFLHCWLPHFVITSRRYGEVTAGMMRSRYCIITFHYLLSLINSRYAITSYGFHDRAFAIIGARRRHFAILPYHASRYTPPLRQGSLCFARIVRLRGVWSIYRLMWRCWREWIKASHVGKGCFRHSYALKARLLRFAAALTLSLRLWLLLYEKGETGYGAAGAVCHYRFAHEGNRLAVARYH